MNINDPKYLQHLHDLPDSYLIDLLLDADTDNSEMIHHVLLERGMSEDAITSEITSQRKSPWNRPYFFWTAARWLTIVNSFIVLLFNTAGFSNLLQSEHIFKGPLLFLVAGSLFAGFIIGYKLTTYTYHGRKRRLFCGFPFPVGQVDLTTGKEIPSEKIWMTVYMSINAIIGVNIALFPPILIYYSL